MDMNSAGEWTYPIGVIMSELIYLDYNCFQRSFDDQGQARIRIETVACEDIFGKAEQGKIRLVWSFIHEDENSVCPFLDRKAEILKLSEICSVEVAPDDTIRAAALSIQKKCGVGAKDALHLACGIHVHVRKFLTCDDDVKRKTGGRVDDMLVMSPTEFVME